MTAHFPRAGLARACHTDTGDLAGQGRRPRDNHELPQYRHCVDNGVAPQSERVRRSCGISARLPPMQQEEQPETASGRVPQEEVDSCADESPARSWRVASASVISGQRCRDTARPRCAKPCSAREIHGTIAPVAASFLHGPQRPEHSFDWCRCARTAAGYRGTAGADSAAAVHNTDIRTRQGRCGLLGQPGAPAGWCGTISFPRIQGGDTVDRLSTAAARAALVSAGQAKLGE
ncbi:hypothetical protein DFQ14_109137 [Halopolyspora algeriensis]|uniref:Uncharacterized protein n=1 Tax=Halopolyspora algeriensis TaxID=1500506 RepID=A0A368VPJ2_9ACTN|nr:hypothetical protein DFQ14_109137 [Halopolyspora algeriensis]TQM53856.1 hypothetical protein FHU43_2029 [Halopolyspora algeriensis]